MIPKKVIVAGHIYLEIIPDLSCIPQKQFLSMLQTARVIDTEGITLRTGGTVPNTGLALYRLDYSPRLIGKIGDDLFGRAVQELIAAEAPFLVQDLVVDPSVPTAYTVMLNPPGVDSTTLHSHGANDWFYASDLPRTTLQDGDLFHFGNPSLMRSIFRHDGAELVLILQRARRVGLTTSLNFSLPDLNSPGVKVNWGDIMANCLPLVDLFFPSAEELFNSLQPETYHRLCADKALPFIAAITPEMLQELSEQVLGYGVKMVMIDLGIRGLYLRTAPAQAWEKGGRGLDGLGDTWFDRELWMPAYEVDDQGNTPAGDATIAGFLAGVLKDVDPHWALRIAAAAGACSLESPDALSGSFSWENLLARIERGWSTLPLDLVDHGWHQDASYGTWRRS